MPVGPIGEEAARGRLGRTITIRDTALSTPSWGFGDFDAFVTRGAQARLMKCCWMGGISYRAPMPLDYGAPISTSTTKGRRPMPWDWTIRGSSTISNPAVVGCAGEADGILVAGTSWSTVSAATWPCWCPMEFWNTTVRRLRRTKADLFMLPRSRGDQPLRGGGVSTLLLRGMHHLMVDVAQLANPASPRCALHLCRPRAYPVSCHAAGFHLEPRREFVVGFRRFDRFGAPAEVMAVFSRSSCRAACQLVYTAGGRLRPAFAFFDATPSVYELNGFTRFLSRLTKLRHEKRRLGVPGRRRRDGSIIAQQRQDC